MTTIALAHFRVGETDGVSLEMTKWATVLRRLGHDVVYIAGNPGPGETHVIPELHYADPGNQRIADNAYSALRDFADAPALYRRIAATAGTVARQLDAIVRRRGIGMVIPNNVWSLGWNLSAGAAFSAVVRHRGLPAVGHHHDFHWERVRYAQPTARFVGRTLADAYPPRLPTARHVVINSLARDEVAARTGMDATVVPNVFDFDQPAWTVDDYNADFRRDAGLRDDDLVLLQATRIIERKGIGMAIALAAALQRPDRWAALTGAGLYDGRKPGRLVLLCPGLPEADPDYIRALKSLADRSGVTMVFVSDRVGAERTVDNGRKVYSLWDAYAHADLVTYPSLLEGFGNQFLEALFARLPIALYEYPVYRADIAPHGFDVASLGDREPYAAASGLEAPDRARLDSAADQCIPLLVDRDRRHRAVTHNFELGRRLYGYDALERHLAALVGTV